MKRLLCFILTILLCAAALTVCGLPTAAADNGKLTITDEGRVLAQVEVGSTFLYRVGLFSGQHTLINGEGMVTFASDMVKPVAYGSPTPEAYSFCGKLQSASPVINISDNPDFIRYNFSDITGISGFNSAEEPYLKLRFQALKAGTVQIHHTMETLTARSGSGSFVKLFKNGKASDTYDAIPYTVSSVETPSAYIGDADNDGKITVIDATCVQWVTAGRRMTYSKANADADGDGDVNLKDALAIRRSTAGLNGGEVGGYRFSSEQ